MPTHPGRSAFAKPGTSSGGWPRVTPPAWRPRGEIQSAGYARRHHLWRDRGRGFNSRRLHSLRLGLDRGAFTRAWYGKGMSVISRKNQVTLPVEALRAAGLAPG